MPNSPYDTPLITDPETVELWRVYQERNRAAAYLYRVLPIAADHASLDARTCGCGRRTNHRSGVCHHCRVGRYAPA